MGAGASALGENPEGVENPSVFDYGAFLEEETALPDDAGDLEGRDPEEIKRELVKLRKFCQRAQDARETDQRNRSDILSQKMDHHSFRGGSLNGMLQKAVAFTESVLKEGYENISPSQRYAGMKNLQNFLNSPALNVMLARKNVQEDLRKQVASNADEDISDYIIGHYASSNNVHDVSLVRERAKTKFTNALAKLKGRFMLNQLIGAKKPQERKRTASFMASSPHLSHLKLDASQKAKLERILHKMGDFNFDVFELIPITNNQPLLVTGMELFKRWELDSKLDLKDDLIAKFFSALDSGYLPNPYHSSAHGADVMYTVNSFIQASTVMHDSLEATDLFGALVAAAAHDFRHDGVNNAFHINTGSPLALRYNDISVLESFHSAELFILTSSDPSVNIFSCLDSGQYKEIRKLITTSILGTDMTKHFNHIADFESRLAAEKHINDNPEVAEHSGTEQRLDKFIMIEMALHCADISNPVKDIMIYKKWVNVVMTEFYQQGDKERDLGMPISAMFDRHNSSVTKTQVGFIEFIIRPIYRVWGDFIPELAETFTENLNAGKAFGWDEWYKLHQQSPEKESIKEEPGVEVEAAAKSTEDIPDHEVPEKMMESNSTPILE
mmetsp:Transcript_14330/g.29485  ORF Transcript_14330/g.29485 Transcript_14330/m.29485 type:complete len:613 (-) Transcript_14330:64-1902(-)|eukprot:CAMPEP_0118647204 /NCGR_PEP_ID=MMETSP0785-20121206/8481_1 /TAXON_ID=91992 /ORGANISM="Bolidomonas pacifica, Strain CCMP 1866" /LENGTH=612 /DNA_ID=CAMNT_0006539281 /DNA_START=539 /DNA_END=2377 /DNA_ORIENTATION=-